MLKSAFEEDEIQKLTRGQTVKTFTKLYNREVRNIPVIKIFIFG